MPGEQEQGIPGRGHTFAQDSTDPATQPHDGSVAGNRSDPRSDPEQSEEEPTSVRVVAAGGDDDPLLPIPGPQETSTSKDGLERVSRPVLELDLMLGDTSLDEQIAHHMGLRRPMTSLSARQEEASVARCLPHAAPLGEGQCAERPPPKGRAGRAIGPDGRAEDDEDLIHGGRKVAAPASAVGLLVASGLDLRGRPRSDRC